MKTLKYLFCTALLALFAVACSDDDSPTGAQDEVVDFSRTLTDYTEKTVVATYADLRDKAAALNDAVVAFNDDPSDQAKLDAAAQAWIAAREPWESSEAFLFGPVAFQGLDPALDTWPVDQQQLQDVLNSSFELTPEFIAEGLGPALRGFHTVEFLLFREGQPRNAADVVAREREYLVAATQVLADDTQALWDAWANDFASEFTNAGKSGSRYFTQVDAVIELIDGMVVILDEVANGKIADPFDEQNTQLVESQFSWNSLTDFQNNIRGVMNAYTGSYHLGEDGMGLDEFVLAENPELDAELKSEIEAAIAAIAAIPEPFRNNLNQSQQIQAAQQAINQVIPTLENELKPLVRQ